MHNEKSRVVISQCFALIGVNILKFTFGCCLGFTTIFLPILYKENAEIVITLNELTWLGSFCFMTPIGAVLGGILAQRIGTRLLTMMAALLFTTSGLIFHWSSNAPMLLCAQAIAGLTGGMMKGPGFTFIAEIAQPHIRSTLMATLNMSILSGVFFSVMLGGHMYWRTIVLVNLTFPVAAFVIIFFIPESPYWLACRHRFHEAENSLAWFRGWADPKSTKTEFHSILSNLKNSSNLRTDALFLESSRKHSRTKQVLRPYMQRSFYIPLATICYLFCINDFSGAYSLQTFAMLVFKKMNSPINEHMATVILSAIRIIGAVSVILTIHFAGKRNLMFFSLLGNGLWFAIAAIFNFLIDQKQLVSHVYYWIPTIAMIMAIFVSAAGINKIVYLLNSEIFPMRQRHVGAGIGHFVSALFEALLNKMFLYMINDITMSGVFIVFAIINIIGFITIYFILPETEGRTLTEIGEHYAGIQSLKHKKKEDEDIITVTYTASNVLLKKV